MAWRSSGPSVPACTVASSSSLLACRLLIQQDKALLRVARCAAWVPKPTVCGRDSGRRRSLADRCPASAQRHAQPKQSAVAILKASCWIGRRSQSGQSQRAPPWRRCCYSEERTARLREARSGSGSGSGMREAGRFRRSRPQQPPPGTAQMLLGAARGLGTRPPAAQAAVGSLELHLKATLINRK